MPCLTNEPPDGGESESLQDRIQKIRIWIKLSPTILRYSVRFLILHREITFHEARLIRATLLHDRKWQWWHVGFSPWFIINWMLMTFDEKKDSLATRIKSGQRALDAFSHVRSALMADSAIGNLIDLWNEFQTRDEESFNRRDRKFFMKHYGKLFSEPARIFFETAMLLRTGDYLVFKYLCCKTCRYLAKRIIRVGHLEENLITFFISHQEECCRQIQHFKPTILDMICQYVDNMIAFCLHNDLVTTAHQWSRVGGCIAKLKDLQPTDDNQQQVRETVSDFFKLIDEANTHVDVKYRELDQRLIDKAAEEAERAHTESSHPSNLENELLLANLPAQKPVAIEAEFTAKDGWTAFYGRDIHWYHISDDGYTITDTTSKDACGNYKCECCGITENSGIVRHGLAFYFSDFEKNCEAHQDEAGDWIVTKQNNFIKMTTDQMKKFRSSLRAIPGMKDFIPNILSPKSVKKRSDGKTNNRSGKYRIEPVPYSSSDYDSCSIDDIR